MKRVKSTHPKANHFVYGYRYLNKMEQIVENSSDDGEPKGTSGKPVLSVLRGNNIINTAVIVVRYFGGVKLGTGGLVRAYTQATNSLLDISSFQDYHKLIDKRLTVSYDYLDKLKYKLKQLEITTIKTKFATDVVLYIKATKEQLDMLELPFSKSN